MTPSAGICRAFVAPALWGGLGLFIAGVSEAYAAAAEDYKRWGHEALAMIERDFAIPGSKLLAEKAAGPDAPKQPAFAWPAGVQLTALSAAARLSPDYHAQLTRYIDGLEAHWIVHRGIGGYNASANATPDRYYDDNAWLVLGLVEAYEATDQRRFLDRAGEAFAFVMSGEDERLGGGIYWRENRRRTKNTCSNAPAIVCALRLYQHTGDGSHLATAERLCRWVGDTLQDKESRLMNDHTRLDGSVDTRRYTYNTGLMIRANALLHQATGQGDYLREAQALAEAAAREWVDAESSVLGGGAKFAHLLLESLLELDGVAQSDKWAPVGRATAQMLRTARDPQTGRYPARWAPASARRPSSALIDQASAARTFLVLAINGR